MFSADSIAEIHLELTERCNAACPMCGRNQQGGAENANLAGREITLADFQSMFDRTTLRRLERLRFCGNFGDPAVASDTLEICEYARSINPRLNLFMNSNGAPRNHDWWFELGRIFSRKGDWLKFGIDGLEDTHALYRRNTSWRRVIEHAEAFIRGGGIAHWVFLVFRHNEHQIDDCGRLATELGFAEFVVKATKRFMRSSDLSVEHTKQVRDGTGKLLHVLEPPSDLRLQNPDVRRADELRGDPDARAALLDGGRIECRSAAQRSIYVSAEGLVFPCCWTAASIYPAHSNGPEGEIWRLIEKLGGKEQLNLRHHLLREIIEGNFMRRVLPEALAQQSIAAGRPRVCARICGGMKSFEGQFLAL